jgi:hypothetical protein
MSQFISFEESEKACRDLHQSRHVYLPTTLVLSVGPWLTQLLPELSSLSSRFIGKFCTGLILLISMHSLRRQFPLFIWQLKGSDTGVYGLPALDGANGGFKIGSLTILLSLYTPDSVKRTVSS